MIATLRLGLGGIISEEPRFLGLGEVFARAGGDKHASERS